MNQEIHLMRGGVTSPKGFLADGVSCGIKKKGKRDLALVYTPTKANAAGVFTKNFCRAACVDYTKKAIKNGTLGAVIINSGNANACTGSHGVQSPKDTACAAGELLGIPTSTVAVCSTGVIGVRLPMKKIYQGLKLLRLSRKHGTRASQAIMTTDKVHKERAVRFSLGTKTVTIGGMAKGAGMIHPNMATMIAVLTTDVHISTPLLNKALKRANQKSFNAITVDGDESTNDTVLLLANGCVTHPNLRREDKHFRKFERALTILMEEFAQDIVRDGEGATKCVEVLLQKAKSESTAKKYAEAISTSALVKTSFYGEDPNWGRIIAAMGSVKTPFHKNRLAIYFDKVCVVKKGVEMPGSQSRAKKVMSKKEFQIRVVLHQGQAESKMWTSDLTHEYIRINANYRS